MLCTPSSGPGPICEVLNSCVVVWGRSGRRGSGEELFLESLVELLLLFVGGLLDAEFWRSRGSVRFGCEPNLNDGGK